VRIAPLDACTTGAWAALFERCGCACHCRYWHFSGTKNEWLARCADAPWQNRDEHVAAVACGSLEAGGLLAFDGDVAVGWMKLVPRGHVAKLLRQGPYRAAPPAAGERDEAHEGHEAIWSIGCFLVDPSWRRRGVARALVQAAPAFVAERGGVTLEAYPRRTAEDLHDAQAFTGTVQLFASCGFEECGGDGPYPIMRRRAAG
jgi:GNAT superfamily N-acetyltransferase